MKRMRKGISGAAFLGVALVGLALVVTLFQTGGGSSLANSSLPAIKASAIDNIEQLEKNAQQYFTNKNTYAGMFVTSPFHDGYLESDAWTDRLTKTDGTAFVKGTDTPAVTDYFGAENIKYSINSDDNGSFFNLYVDASGYSTDTAILGQIEEYVYGKVVSRYGTNRVSGTATALSNTAIAANTAKNTDGKILITIYKKL